MTKVIMKAIDTLHLSSVGPENIAPGGSFQVSEADAKQLEERGLAKRATAAKSESALEKKTPSPAPPPAKRKGK